MAKRFENLQIEDQLVLPASRGAVIYGAKEDFDPNRIIKVAIVTHCWFDPVEEKEYFAIAHLRNDGTYGKPKEKRTMRGLAQCGWKKSDEDWIAKIKNIQANKDTVVPIFGRRSK